MVDITLQRRPHEGSMPSEVIPYMYEGQKHRYYISVYHEWEEGQETPNFEKVVEVIVGIKEPQKVEFFVDTLEEAKERIKELEEE